MEHIRVLHLAVGLYIGDCVGLPDTSVVSDLIEEMIEEKISRGAAMSNPSSCRDS